MSDSEKHYTFNTAALKAVTMDGLLANFRKTDTKSLSIDGVDIKDLIKSEGGFDFKRDWKELILDKESKIIVSNYGTYIVLDEHGNLIIESESIYEELVDGSGRYAKSVTPLIFGKEFEKTFPKLKIGKNMFLDKGRYEKFIIDCPVLEDVEYMFSGFSCEYFKGTFPSLTSVNNMFERTSKYWGADQNGFYVSEMELNIPNVKDCSYLFGDVGSIGSLSGDFSSMEDASHMFVYTTIGDFNVELPNLKWGYGMFGDDIYGSSKLNKKSTIHVITSLKEKNTWDGSKILNKYGYESGTLTLSIDTKLKNDSDIMSLLNLTSTNNTKSNITCKGGGVWDITIIWR